MHTLPIASDANESGRCTTIVDLNDLGLDPPDSSEIADNAWPSSELIVPLTDTSEPPAVLGNLPDANWASEPEGEVSATGIGMGSGIGGDRSMNLARRESSDSTSSSVSSVSASVDGGTSSSHSSSDDLESLPQFFPPQFFPPEAAPAAPSLEEQDGDNLPLAPEAGVSLHRKRQFSVEVDENGDQYFVDNLTQETTWDLPANGEVMEIEKEVADLEPAPGLPQLGALVGEPAPDLGHVAGSWQGLQKKSLLQMKAARRKSRRSQDRAVKEDELLVL
jgi:hypothetical protein